MNEKKLVFVGTDIKEHRFRCKILVNPTRIALVAGFSRLE